LTSQTHVAVDNAAVRLAALRPDLRIVRVGRAERISEDARELAVPAQLARWRKDAQERARDFLAAWAQDRGIEDTARTAHAQLAGRLASPLGLDNDATVEAFEAGVDARFPIDEDELASFNELVALQEEWLQRFGQGTEFQRALIEVSDVVAGTCVGLASTLGG